MPTGYKATIYVDSGSIGHAFIKLEAPGQPAVTVGYYPVAHLPAAPGIVKDDSQVRDVNVKNSPPVEHPSDWNKSFDIDSSQYAAMVKYVAAVANNPGDYGLLGNQCTGFALDTLKAGGINSSSQLPDMAVMHPTQLKDAFGGMSSDQVRPLSGMPDVSHLSSDIQAIHVGIAGNEARAASFAQAVQGALSSADPLGNYQPGTSTNDSASSAPSSTASGNAAGSTQLPPISPSAQDADMGSLNTSGGDNVSSGSLNTGAAAKPDFTPLPSTGVEGNSYTIQSGDNLWKIGKSLGLSDSQTAKFVSDVQADYQAQGLGGNINDLRVGNTLKLPDWVKDRLDAQQVAPNSATPAAETGGTPEFKSTLTEDQAGQLLQDLGLKKDTPTGPALVIAAAGDGIQTDGGLITGYAENQASNQAPAQADSAQGAINSEANTVSLTQATQSAALLSGLVGLQHWAGMSDVQRLTALSSLYNVADKLGGDSLPGDLGGAAAALSLVGNLERGNLGGTVVSAISLTNVLADDMASKAIANALGVKAANVIPGISLALALNSGDPVSMMAAAANFIPVYGPLISIGLSLLGSGGLFGGAATPPPPYGEVHFAWSGLDANGQPHTAVRTDANVSGGAATASQIAGQLLGNLQTMVEQANAQTLHDHPDTAPSQLLALNTNLLPSVFWDKDQTSLKLPNPDGVTSFFVNLAEPDAMSQVVQLLQTNGGIAPQWLVDTQGQLCIWSAPNAKTSAMHKTMTRSCWHQSRQQKVARKFDRLGLNKNV